MKYNKILTIIACIGIVSVSCDKWLEVTPQGDVDAKEFLTTANGYNAALGGVYYLLTSSTLYGSELTYGAMDALAQYWDLSTKTSHAYYKLALYDYADNTSRGYFSAIWSKMYEAIAQLNLIIESFEENRNQIPYSELIEGEAYALRAFIHLELAAMYGPVIKTSADLDKLCVAYRTGFNTTAQKFDSYNSLFTKAEQDLKKSLELLKNDPIIDNPRYYNGNASLLDYHAVLERRGSRMNYYGAKALLMRIELARLNKPAAYTMAKELIDEFERNERFSLVTSTTDKNLGGEMLSALYVNNLWSTADEVFVSEKVTNSNRSLVISADHYNTILNHIYGREPDGSGTDNRLRSWFEKAQSTLDYYAFLKYQEVPYQGMTRLAYYPEVPIVRLAEIYFTACETQIGVNNTLALEYLNTVRAARNLSDLDPITDDGMLLDMLLREMRKDYIGEGRMFLTYKRLFQPFYVRQGVMVGASDEIFVFPIPDSEYEFSPNEKL